MDIKFNKIIKIKSNQRISVLQGEQEPVGLFRIQTKQCCERAVLLTGLGFK